MKVLLDLLSPRPLAHTPADPADQRRRLVVVVVTLAAGAIVLGAILARPRGSGTFTLLGLVLAAIWLGGTALAGGTRLGLHRLDRDRVIAAVAVGFLAYLAFLVAALVAQEISVLKNAVDSIFDQADTGPLAVVLAIALIDAVAEEVFFRGVLLDTIGPRYGPVAATVIYVAVTAAALNLALVLAAVVMGVLWMVERLSTGSPLASVLTHVTWSTLMLLAFPF